MTEAIIPYGRIRQAILLIRGHKVMLDCDLAALYKVRTGALKRAVMRNSKRFPDDFMFVLNDREIKNLRCQIGTSSSWGGLRYAPMAFTEQGVSMLSSVLKSERAVQVNIAIMRIFAQLRHLLATHADLARKLEELEMKYDHQFRVVFDAIRRLINPPERPRKRIGFLARDPGAKYRRRRRHPSKRLLSQ